MKWLFATITGLLFIACDPSDFDGKNGVMKVYYSGTEQIKQEIQYKNGRKNGYAKEYYSNGKLKLLQHFVNDSLNDSCKTYYKNGILESIQTYKNKEKHGCWKQYTKEGKIFSEINFKAGLLHGESKEYTYRSGRIVTKVNYDNGLKHGKEELYYDNGHPKSVCYYDRGKVCTGTQEWSDNGKPINNDFKISVTEKNDVLLANKLVYYIKLERPQADDKVYQVLSKDTGNVIGAVYPLKKENGNYILEYHVASNGGFVMETVKIAAYRKTALGNTLIKTSTFVASANNF